MEIHTTNSLSFSIINLVCLTCTMSYIELKFKNINLKWRSLILWFKWTFSFGIIYNLSWIWVNQFAERVKLVRKWIIVLFYGFDDGFYLVHSVLQDQFQLLVQKITDAMRSIKKNLKREKNETQNLETFCRVISIIFFSVKFTVIILACAH